MTTLRNTWRTLTTVGLTAALVLGGTGLAGAAEPTPPQEPITLTAEQSARICQERIPAILARIDAADDRLDADAGTPGSTAWLQQQADDARAAGRDQRADRLQERLSRRLDLSERLADAGMRVEAFRTAYCAA